MFFPRPKMGGTLEHQRSRSPVANMLRKLQQNLWRDEQGQDIAEYAVMLAVILVIVVGTVKLIGTNAGTVFSNVASSIQ
jgi:Flp pilus assembly pilin Flp